MPQATVLFDLDGTLLATSADLLASLNHVLEGESLPALSEKIVNFRFGQGARVMIAFGFNQADRHATPDHLDRLTEKLVDHYAGNMPGQTRPFPGLLSALDRLEAAGMRLAVCTNKRENLAVRLLESMNLRTRFAAVGGGDTYHCSKPEPDHLLMTIADAGGDPALTVMIGDSRSDILGARNAGIPSIAVPFGYSDVPVASLKPDHIINHFDELGPELINALLGI